MYLYRLLSFFNHRRQNQEFLIFTSKFEILLMRLKAAWMDLMPVFTAQSPSFRRSVQDANARTIARHQQAAGVRAPPPALRTIQQSSDSISKECRTDLKEATEAIHSSSSNKVNTKEKKASGLRMKNDLKDSCQTTMKRRSGSSRRTMRS